MGNPRYRSCFFTGSYDNLKYHGGIRYHFGLSIIIEGYMSLFSSATVLRLVDSMAILLSQAYQLSRARLASAGSPVLRLLVQRDQETTETDLLRREVEILRAQRGGLPPHRRPNYQPGQRLAILQLRRLRR